MSLKHAQPATVAWLQELVSASGTCLAPPLQLHACVLLECCAAGMAAQHGEQEAADAEALLQHSLYLRPELLGLTDVQLACCRALAMLRWAGGAGGGDARAAACVCKLRYWSTAT